MKGNGIESSTERPVTLRSALHLAARDIGSNPGDIKAQFVLVFFRLAHWARSGGRQKLLATAPFVACYRIIVEFIMGIELRPRTRIGPGIRLYHGQGLVVNDRTVIGSNVTLRHGVTIGSAVDGGACPTIGDGVEFGAGSMVLGGVNIGNGAKIGAGAVVVRDVPADAVARGPAASIFVRDEPRTSVVIDV